MIAFSLSSVIIFGQKEDPADLLTFQIKLMSAYGWWVRESRDEGNS